MNRLMFVSSFLALSVVCLLCVLLASCPAIRRRRGEHPEDPRPRREGPAHRHHHAPVPQGGLPRSGKIFRGICR